MPLVTVRCVTGHRRKTPLRTLQVETSAKDAGTARPDALREFMDWVNADPELWAEVRHTAEERGETMRAAVLRGLARYLDQPNP
jgi:glycerol-3-phosphate dehydrogenase